MDLKLDMTTDMPGPVTAPMGFQSEGLGEVTSPPATNTVGQWPSVMGPPIINLINSPFLNPLGGLSEGLSCGRLVWMWLESSQLHTLPTYQTELRTIAVVLVQVTGHAPIHIQ